MPSYMQGEGAVIREEIERAAAGARVLSYEYSVFALIEERACFLSGPGSREISHTILHHLDELGNLPVGGHHFQR